MDMSVTAVPGILTEVAPSSDAEPYLSLAGFDLNRCPNWFIFEATGDFDRDLAHREPPLTVAVDDGVGGRPQSNIATHIDVPAGRITVDMAVVAVRLPRNSRRRP